MNAISGLPDPVYILGGEGGGHTGDIPFSILIPACVDAVEGRKSPLTGEPVMVVAAGTRYLFNFTMTAA